MADAIDIEGLVKTYGEVHALNGIDLAVHTGEIFGVIGPNGAGKTTIMRILLDIIRPTSGRVSIFGMVPSAAGGSLRRRIGYLPGELMLPGRTEVLSLLEFYGRLSGGVEPRRITELADRFGLDVTRQVRTLSKGNKQKLGVIQAFMHEPELLVLDEPTSGLDPLLQQEFLALVREAQHEGSTVFLSSHVLSEIQHVADRVAILRAGAIVTVSDVDGLRRMASRQLRFRLRRPIGADAVLSLPMVEAVAHEGEWTVIDVGLGAVLDPILELAIAHGIDDLIAEEPDLERAVLDLYRGGDLPSVSAQSSRPHQKAVS